MSEHRSQGKFRKIIIGIVFGIVAIIAGLLILLPTLVNTETIRAKIEDAASHAIEGQVDFEKIRLSLLPRPHVVISHGQMAIQDRVKGAWTELSVFLKLRALFAARLEVSDLKLKQPDFELRLPVSSRHKLGKNALLMDSDNLRRQLKEGLGTLVAMAKGVEVEIDDGRLRVLEQDKSPLEWQNITTHLRVTEKRVAVHLICGFSFIKKIDLTSELNLATLNLSGKITLQNLVPHQFTTYWRPASDLKIADGSVDLTLQFQSQDWRNWQGDFESHTSILKVQYNTRQAEIGPAILKGRFNYSHLQTTLQIDRLNLDNPQLSLVGNLLMDASETAGVHLQATGENVNVGSVRSAALSLGGNIPDVRNAFDFVKGGQITTIKLDVQGKDWSDFSDIKRWHIEGEMADGAIFIPQVNLDLTDVHGHGIIKNGILTVKSIRANYGKSHARQGSMKIGITGDVNPLHLDIDVNADLSELPSILNRVLDNKKLKPELSRIEHLSGMGNGKLILGGNLDNISIQIHATEYSFNVRYNRLPYALKVKGGRFRFKDDEIRVGDLRVQMGNTYFSKISGGINWRKAAKLNVRTGAGTIVLPEIYPWLKKQLNLADSLKTIEASKGSISVSTLNLKGLLSSPATWRYDVSGNIKNLALQSARLSKPLVLSKGHFKLAPESFILTKGRAQILDLKTDFSIQIAGYMEGVKKLNYSGNGNIGSDFNRWLNHEIKIPDPYHIKLPITFKNLEIEWNRPGKLAVSGRITTSNGQMVTADMRLTPDEINIRKLTLHDHASDVEFSLKHMSKERISDLIFKGHLAKVSLDRLLMKNQFLEGAIKGYFNAQIDSKHPLNSVVNGNLEARQVLLPFKRVGQLRIDQAALSASEKKVTIHEAKIEWLANRFNLDGSVTFKPGNIFLQMNTKAKEIDLAKLETLFKDSGKNKNKNKTLSLSIIQGKVHIDTERLKYGFYTWTPYRATLKLEKNNLIMRINEANLCGIETLGTVNFSQRGLWIEIIPRSQRQDIQHVSGCITGKSTSEILEGQFQTTGAVETEGKTAGELLRNLKGHIEVTIKDGRIYNMGRVGTFTNILSFLKVNSLIEGDVPDLKNNDFRYKLISTKYHIQDGKFILDEGYLNSRSLHIVATEGELNLIDHTMDFNILVSPFTTVDTIISKIPLIGHIFQGTLIAIPLKVKGDVSNPEVKALSPSAIGSRAMNILERTLKAPVRIINFVVPGTSSPQRTDHQNP